MDNWAALESTETGVPVRHGAPRVWWWSAAFAVLVHALLLAIWSWMAWTQREDAPLSPATHWVDWRPSGPALEEQAPTANPAKEQGHPAPPTQPQETDRTRAKESQVEPAGWQAARPTRANPPVETPASDGPDGEQPRESAGPGPSAASPQRITQPSKPPMPDALNLEEEGKPQANTDAGSGTTPPLSPKQSAWAPRDRGDALPQVPEPARQEGIGSLGAERVAIWLSANPRPVYPAASRRLGEQGTVDVVLRFDSSATLLAAWIERSSGFYRLDEAALRAVKNWRYPVALRPLTGPHEVRIPVVFSLSLP